MKKSSRRKRKNDEVVIIVALLLVILVIICIALLAVVGYDVNQILVVYSVLVTIMVFGMYIRLIKISDLFKKQNSQNIVQIQNIKDMISEYEELEKKYDAISEELRISEQKRNISDRMGSVYKGKAKEVDEILKKIEKAYPEIVPQIAIFEDEVRAERDKEQK